MKGWLKRQLTRFCYSHLRGQSAWSHPDAPEVLHTRVLPYASYAPWLNDVDFLASFERVRAHTLVDIYRLYELWQLVRQLDDVGGDFLEVGVWRGGSGCLLGLASLRVERRIYLADTFTGVVKVGPQDTRYRGGEHADTVIEQVRELARSCGLEQKVVVLPGIFPECNAEHVGRRIALLHIDVDVYESARDVLNWAIPRLVQGGVVVFDDYGFHGCEGVTRLVNELVVGQSAFRFLHNLNGHAVLVRVNGEIN